jgi:small subunit ribosomal protein S16
VAVKIRLMRVGKKKQPTYRVVVADGRSPRDGRFIEIIGQYAPRQDPSFCQIDAESALSWLRKGAQPTEQVQKLLTEQGVWAQYEAERSKPAVTKLSRRGYVSGKVAPGVKQPKAAPEPEPAAAEADTGNDEAETPGVVDEDSSAEEAADAAIEEAESQ